METITLKELKENHPNLTWMNANVKGSKDGWMETKIQKFSGKTKMFFGDSCVSFSAFTRKNECIISIVCVKNLKLRVEIWNKKTKCNDKFKVIF